MIGYFPGETNWTATLNCLAKEKGEEMAAVDGRTA
jgi:hypothetical protein